MTLQWVDWLVLGVLTFGWLFFAIGAVLCAKDAIRASRANDVATLRYESGNFLVAIGVVFGISLAIALYWKFLAG